LETRNSHGLEQFCASIQDRSGLSILDLAGANQGTVTFVTSLGHRLYSDDILRTLDAVYGENDFQAHNDPEQVAKFLEQSLDFPEDHFDGALIWDTLQFLPPSILPVAVDRLRRILKPDSRMLALFHSEQQLDAVPAASYRISDARTILVTPRGAQRKAAQHFNNRSLEKLFQDYTSVKFFLTRDHLREVIVRR
jgi:hypothetical protein